MAWILFFSLDNHFKNIFFKKNVFTKTELNSKSYN